MIISKKYKYIFIGLPFAASSAISKELLDFYDGEPLYHKHSNIPLLLNLQPDFPLEEYTVFAVIRNPIDANISVYNKHLTNPYNTFTDEKYFIENGGFVTKKARLFYDQFIENEWSFNEFLYEKHKLLPYDNNLSVNSKYLTHYIRFEYLNEDFLNLLNTIKITPVKDLQVYNKTKKIVQKQDLDSNLMKTVFGPFLNHNKKFYQEISMSAPFIKNIIFKLFRLLRNKKVLNYDLKQASNHFSIQDLKNER